mmetsp:Transcript_24687/g.21859  ORF Transcript_24687/g.21859 Transcript_24687/m.21859 type:complete len:81 (-) Transcript_24687:229-471(-)
MEETSKPEQITLSIGHLNTHANSESSLKNTGAPKIPSKSDIKPTQKDEGKMTPKIASDNDTVRSQANNQMAMQKVPGPSK